MNDRSKNAVLKWIQKRDLIPSFQLKIKYFPKVSKDTWKRINR